jgi:hypothetical protein
LICLVGENASKHTPSVSGFAVNDPDLDLMSIVPVQERSEESPVEVALDDEESITPNREQIAVGLDQPIRIA